MGMFAIGTFGILYGVSGRAASISVAYSKSGLIESYIELKTLSMMMPIHPESEALQEEVRSLEAQVACLHQLVADLLVKNQHLREALKTHSRVETRLTVKTTLPIIRVNPGACKPDQPKQGR